MKSGKTTSKLLTLVDTVKQRDTDLQKRQGVNKIHFSVLRYCVVIFYTKVRLIEKNFVWMNLDH